MKTAEKAFIRKLKLKTVASKLPNTNFLAVFLISIVLAGFLSLSPALSALISGVTIKSSGKIGTISPLHVDGKYIKDSSGNIVYLRGVNKAEFTDYPGNVWMGVGVSDYASWTARLNDVRTELDAMKSWGINVIRAHQVVEHWKYNMGNNRQIIKELLSLCAERGIYLIYDVYGIRNYFDGGTQDPLPYPPYQTSENASAVIASQDDFVDWWVSVATELKDYPNVIFELWNEPHGDATAESSWFSVAQRCINAIRALGANQLIIFQWDYGVWVDLDNPPPSGSASTMDWITQANMTDPAGNLAYSTHIYRNYGAFMHSVPTTWYAWNYTDIDLAFQYMKLYWVSDTLNKPLIIGEIGADLSYTGTELDHELTAFDNCFNLFTSHDMHYIAFWWRNIGLRRLLESGVPWVPPPSSSGQILQQYLLNQTG